MSKQLDELISKGIPKMVYSVIMGMQGFDDDLSEGQGAEQCLEEFHWLALVIRQAFDDRLTEEEMKYALFDLDRFFTHQKLRPQRQAEEKAEEKRVWGLVEAE